MISITSIISILEWNLVKIEKRTIYDIKSGDQKVVSHYIGTFPPGISSDSWEKAVFAGPEKEWDRMVSSRSDEVLITDGKWVVSGYLYWGAGSRIDPHWRHMPGSYGIDFDVIAWALMPSPPILSAGEKTRVSQKEIAEN